MLLLILHGLCNVMVVCVTEALIISWENQWKMLCDFFNYFFSHSCYCKTLRKGMWRKHTLYQST